MKNFGIIAQCQIHNELKTLRAEHITAVGVVRGREFIFPSSIKL